MASITCPVCGRTSHNSTDVTQGYCGYCHDWTGAVRSMVDHPFTPGMTFDRQGHPITLARFCYLSDFTRFEDYRRIAYVDLGDGLCVSTVWLGASMNFLDVNIPTETFETALRVDGEYVQFVRSDTEDEARHTHDTLVRSLQLVGRDFLVAELTNEEDT